MSDMKLGIELVLKGAEQVSSGIRGITASVKTIADEFKVGLVNGMNQAVKDAERPMSELKKTAEEARKALSIRPDIEIEGEIAKTRKAYEDLANSGQATAGELNRAKDSMKKKIGELRVEMGKWSGDWEDLGKKAQEYGSKLQGIGAKAMIAGAPAFIAGKDAIKAEYDLAGVANTAGLDPAKAAEAVAKWKSQINELARHTNQTQSELIGALGTFVSKGMDPEAALEMLRSVGKAATATSSEVNDIAESMYQAGESLKIPLSDASKSLDMMAAAGAAGSFELKNMAKDLPNLSAKYASLGGTGADALGSITAGAQIAMKTTSDAAVAANNFKNFLDKLAAPETIKNFDKMGVNLTKQVKKGVKSGDLVGYMGKVIADMTQGKAENLGKLFTDAQARDFALALTQNVDEYKKIRGEVMSAVGTIDQQAAVMAQTTQEKIKGIGISMNVALDEATMFKTALDGIKAVAEWFAANPEVFGPIATVVTALAVGGAGIVVAGTALSAVGTALGIIAAAGPALVLAAPAIATIVGAIAAWKVGEAIGTWFNDQINLLVQAITGDQFASLGTVLYDIIEGPNGIIAIFSSIPEKLAGLWESIKKAGSDLIQKMKEGISDGLKGALGIGDKLKEGIAFIKTTAKDWFQVGRDIIQGLIDGVTAKAKAVIDKVRNLGSEAVAAMKRVLDMRSPSKVFMVIGEQIGEGMEIGMIRKVKDIHAAAQKLGAAAVYGAKDNMTALWIKGQLKDYDALVKDLEDDAARAAKAHAKAREDMIREAKKLTESLRTATERQMDDFERYDEMLEAGALSWDEYARAVAAGHEAMSKSLPEAAKAVPAEEAKKAASEWDEAAKEIERSLTDALMRGFEGGKDWLANLKDTIVNTFKTMVLKPIAVQISASLLGVAGLTGSGGAAANTIGGASNLLSMGSAVSGLSSMGTMAGYSTAALSGGILAGATQGGMLAAQTGAFGAFGASSTAAALGGSSIMSTIGAAMPVLGAIALVASLFKKKPSDKSAWGSVDLATGGVGAIDNMGGSKVSQENMDAASAALTATAGWSKMLEDLGGTMEGSIKVLIGSRDGLRADLNGDGNFEVNEKTTEAFFDKLFKAIVESATGLDDVLKSMLVSFDGTADELTQFAGALLQMREYTDGDVMQDALDQIEQAGRSAWDVWRAGNTDLASLAANFDGSLSSAQALGAATASMYQQELFLVGQIQGLLQSTGGMFASSIRDIQMSVMTDSERYDFLRTEIDGLYSQLSTAFDPTIIGNLAQQINALTNQAYGMLGEDQRAGASGEFIGYLEDVNTLTTERLNASQAQIVEQHQAMAEVIEASMQKVADQMMAAAVAQREAAATALAAAQTEQRIRLEWQNSVMEVGQG